jgi:hypothetical protein
MILIIDNLDYTSALDAARPLSIERTLNAPSVCQFRLALPQDGSLPAPARLQPISVTGDNGIVYFTGYIAATPLPEYAGLAIEGPRYRLAVEAVSDEILLDQALASPAKPASGLTAASAMANLVTHTGSAALSTGALTLDAPISQFLPEPGAPFSKSAGQLAAQVRAAYRAHSGALTVTSIPAAIHPLNESGGNLTLANLILSPTAKRALANDITVCGEHEPAAYITECFLGDGVTAQFNLAADPFFPPASKTTLIPERFDEAAIDTTVWGNSGGSTYFSLGAAGLQMNGGSGIDGQTQLTWIDPVEMGGTLLLEAQGVTLAPASTGILAAFYSGDRSASSCTAGFQATAQQGTGAVSLQPIVQGAASGTAFAVNPANQYTLRIRIHCPEPQRALATYLSCGDDGPITTGGQLIAAPANLLFEIQEFVNGVAAMPVTLYDGVLAALPAACLVAAAASLNLHGSLRALHLTSLGSAWVVSTPPNGSPYTRRLGSTAQSAECHVDRTGQLIFYIGFVPAAGEQIAITYRGIVRAVGRQVNAESLQLLAQQGSPATSAWIGAVTQPPARSSADCRNAASAIAQSAASESALWSGAYRGSNFDFAADVWPGDALALNAPSCGLNAQLIVRTVKLSYRAAVPDLIAYEIAFANDWANDLAIRSSATVPADAWLPAPIAPAFAENLNTLAVTALTGNTVTVNTGANPPSGGGFEVRTRDHAFLPGEDPSLVLRGSQPNLTFSRRSAGDRFYIRMFDAADPPNYSEWSAALILNLPLTT